MSFLNNLRSRRDDDISSAPQEERQPAEPRGDGFKPNPRQVVSFVFITILLAGMVCAIAGITLLRPAAPVGATEVEAVPDYAVQTAREAYVPAVAVIRAQDAGATLASGVGVWNPVIDQTYLKSGRTGWTFYFYMPATRQMATVVVDRDGAAYVEQVEDWDSVPALLDDIRWQIDSSMAMGSFLETCGDMLAETPDARVEARLSTATSNLTLLWQIELTSVADPLAVCQVNIDAVTGLER